MNAPHVKWSIQGDEWRIVKKKDVNMERYVECVSLQNPHLGPQ